MNKIHADINKLMEERERLLLLRDETMQIANDISDKIGPISEEIANNEWIKKNKIEWWNWKPGIGFPHQKQKTVRKNKNQEVKNKVVVDPEVAIKKSRLDELIKIVNKNSVAIQSDAVAKEQKEIPAKDRPFEFSRYPDSMEERAYKKKV